MKRLLVLSFLILLPTSVLAQALYDDEPQEETFMFSVGGFYSNNYDSKIRIDSTQLGVGTIINLEDNLGLDKSVGVVKVDGFYRFSPKYRMEFSYISTNRKGYAEINEDLQIGDQVYAAGNRLTSQFRSNILKVDWAYSFINVKKYEAKIGLGLNIRQALIDVDGVVAETNKSVSVSEYLPLPTFNVGFRYNFTNNLALHYRSKIFAVNYGDYKGRIKDTTFALEHNTFSHIGFGLGINAFSSNFEAEGNNFRGEIETSYMGLLLYMKGYY